MNSNTNETNHVATFDTSLKHDLLPPPTNIRTASDLAFKEFGERMPFSRVSYMVTSAHYNGETQKVDVTEAFVTSEESSADMPSVFDDSEWESAANMKLNRAWGACKALEELIGENVYSVKAYLG